MLVPVRRWLAASGAAAMLAGCTTHRDTDRHRVADFAAGVCRQAAPAVLDIGRLVRQVEQSHQKPGDAEPAMTKDQAILRRLPAAAEPSVRTRLDVLITAIGFLRINLDSNAYQRKQLDDVRDAQQALEAVCTTQPSPDAS
jgi:hypothetical protein